MRQGRVHSFQKRGKFLCGKSIEDNRAKKKKMKLENYIGARCNILQVMLEFRFLSQNYNSGPPGPNFRKEVEVSKSYRNSYGK